MNLYNTNRTVGTPVYSRFGPNPGSRTLKIVKVSSTWISINSFSVQA